MSLRGSLSDCGNLVVQAKIATVALPTSGRPLPRNDTPKIARWQAANDGNTYKSRDDTPIYATTPCCKYLQGVVVSHCFKISTMNEKNHGVKAPLLLALLLGLACAFLLPPYSGPDENGHVAYVAALAQGHLPIIPDGEIADIARGISWQGQHPPLFYALGAPLHLLSGQNATTSLYLLRVLNVLLLLLVVWLVYRVAWQLMPPRAACAAAFIVALHPTLVYTSSMVNNEMLAVVFSLLCVHNALRWCDEEDENARKRIFLWIILCAGLALWTKLTAIAGVVAAATIVWNHKAESSVEAKNGDYQWRAALMVLVGAVLLWLPWAGVMKTLHGVWVPSPVQRPALVSGFWSLTLSPLGWLLAFLSIAEMSIGLLVPYWLIAPYAVTYYPMLAIGLLVALWAITIGRRQSQFRFCVVAWWALLLLLIAQSWLRDTRVSLFAARYVPILVALFALPAAEIWHRQTPTRRLLLTIFGLLLSLITFAYIFLFFLHGDSSGMIWESY